MGGQALHITLLAAGGQALRITLLAAAALLLLVCTPRAPTESASIVAFLDPAGKSITPLVVGVSTQMFGQPITPLVVGVSTQTFLRAVVNLNPPRLPVEYRWEWLRLEQTAHGVRETADYAGEVVYSPSKPGGEYFASAQPGRIRLTFSVRYKGRTLVHGDLPVEVVATRVAGGNAPAVSLPALPGAPAQPASEPTRPPPPGHPPQASAPPLPNQSEDAARGLAVIITSPQGGARVSQVMTVEGKVRALRTEEHLVLFVRSTAAPEESQPWIVQASPQRSPDGTWASTPVFMGLPDDLPGGPVRLCILITAELLSRGQDRDKLPSVPDSYCIDVRRG